MTLCLNIVGPVTLSTLSAVSALSGLSDSELNLYKNNCTERAQALSHCNVLPIRHILISLVLLTTIYTSSREIAKGTP